MFQKMLSSCLGFALGMLSVSAAHAMLINIDFGGDEYTDQGIFGNNTDTYWNSLSYAGFTNLRYADGFVSDVDVTTTFDGSFTNPVSGGSINRTNDLLRDRVFGTTGTPPGSEAETVTLSGLSANTAYDIVLYNGFYAQIYSIAGQGISASTDPAEFSANNDYPWTEGLEYAILESAMSDSSGELVITVTPYPGSNSAFGVNSAIAGLQIQQSAGSVPEPTTLALLSLGLAGLGFTRRRMKA
jgi:hypothetical protein